MFFKLLGLFKMAAQSFDACKESAGTNNYCQLLKRLEGVKGHGDRINDVIYCPPALISDQSASTVVFFGGDVQDYPERMLAHRDNHRHVKWNLEATCEHLANGGREVMVVRPSRMFLSTFSCYDNFVRSSQIGAPLNAEHDPHHGGLDHLAALVRNVQKITSSPSMTPSSSSMPLSCVLVGFSKGCVVLNQIVHEIHHRHKRSPSGDDDFVQKFLGSIRHMIWLDGGHAGGSNAWITDREVLSSLVETKISLSVHVTPYQMEDANRPWVRREKKVFVDTLQRLLGREREGDIADTLHFDGQAPSIEMHFELITEFMKSPNF